jgi:hypothetical protein
MDLTEWAQMAEHGCMTTPGGTWTFEAVDLVHKFGFNDGDMPHPVLDALYDVCGNTEVGDAMHAWQGEVLGPLVTSTLIPAIPHTITMQNWSDGSTHNPLRIETFDGAEINYMTGADAVRSRYEPLLAPYRLTVSTAFLTDACLGLSSPKMFARMPLDVVTAAFTAGFSASEIRNQWRNGALTSESAKDLAVLAALRA